MWEKRRKWAVPRFEEEDFAAFGELFGQLPVARDDSNSTGKPEGIPRDLLDSLMLPKMLLLPSPLEEEDYLRRGKVLMDLLREKRLFKEDEEETGDWILDAMIGGSPIRAGTPLEEFARYQARAAAKIREKLTQIGRLESRQERLDAIRAFQALFDAPLVQDFADIRFLQDMDDADPDKDFLSKLDTKRVREYFVNRKEAASASAVAFGFLDQGSPIYGFTGLSKRKGLMSYRIRGTGGKEFLSCDPAWYFAKLYLASLVLKAVRKRGLELCGKQVLTEGDRRPWKYFLPLLPGGEPNEQELELLDWIRTERGYKAINRFQGHHPVRYYIVRSELLPEENAEGLRQEVLSLAADAISAEIISREEARDLRSHHHMRERETECSYRDVSGNPMELVILDDHLVEDRTMRAAQLILYPWLLSGAKGPTDAAVRDLLTAKDANQCHWGRLLMVLAASLLRTEHQRRESRKFRRQEGGYALSYITKKNIPAATVEYMKKSRFNDIFGYLELDELCDTAKVDTVYAEFAQFYQRYFSWKDCKEVSLRFRRLGKHKASGLYYPALQCICIDIRECGSMVHEFGHMIDDTEGKLSEQDAFARVRHLYEKEVRRHAEDFGSGKYDLSYFLQPTEIFARAMEMYFARHEGFACDLLTMTAEGSAYPDTKEINAAVDAYFDAFFSMHGVETSKGESAA